MRNWYNDFLRAESISILFLFFFVTTRAQEPVINEVMHANATTIADEFGVYSDWIELYNPTNQLISIEGYYLSDDADNLQKWQFPEAFIPAGSHLIIFASDNDLYSSEFFHTNFKLSADGEALFLSNPSEEVIDSYESTVMQSDQSYGRTTDGSGVLIIFDQATPGYSNELGIPGFVYSDSLFFSTEQGIFPQSFFLQISNNDVDATVRYTTNGSNPTEFSPVFSDVVLIENRASEPNSISTIPTNPPGTYGSLGWLPPDGPVFKGTVVKAQSFKDGQPISEISTKSYFVHPDLSAKYAGMPVISIVTDSLHLFDYETGIYVPGMHHDEDTVFPAVYGVGNYNLRGMEWERPVNVTLFESDGTIGFSQNLGLRIHGGGSRQLPLKALRLYARSMYGDSEINYKFFPWKETDKFKRILLRSGGNEFNSAIITDAISAALMSKIGEGYQDTRPAVLFINGEFWGIHNIRDRLDEHYLEYRFGVDHEQVEIVKNWVSADPGTMDHYYNLVGFINENDLTVDANYEYVASQIDMSSLLDNYIVRLYTAVPDWPHNNMSFWRRTDVPGDKWKWLFFDNDKSMLDPTFDAIAHSTSSTVNPAWNAEVGVFLYKNLMKNASFKQQLAERFRNHLENHFRPEQIIGIADSISSQIAPVMQEHINRWRFPASYAFWESNVQVFEDFAKDRPCYMIDHIYKHLGIIDSTYAIGVCDSLAVPKKPQAFSDEFWLWPNPSSDEVNLRYPQFSEVSQISVYTISGKYVKTPVLNPSGDRHISFSVNDLPIGLYVIHIRTQLGLFHRKLVVGD